MASSKKTLDGIENKYKICIERIAARKLILGSYIEDLEKVLWNVRQKNNPSPSPSFNISNTSGIDLNKAYKIISQVESNGKSHVIGDAGTSFGLTQVHAPYLMQMLSLDEGAQQHMGVPAEHLKKMSSEWIKIKKQIKTKSIWKKETVDPRVVKNFIEANPNSVVKRMEGTTIKYGPDSIIKKRGNDYIKKTINWDVLKDLGFNIYDSKVRADVEYAIGHYITENVMRSSLAQIYVKNQNPRAFNRFKQTFSSKNIKQDGTAKQILDKASQRDFMQKVGSVISALRKSNYDTGVPGALNEYQLIAIANASGPKVVREFLLNGGKLYSGNLHYLIRANKYIQKETGMPSPMPSDPHVGFKTASFNYIIKKAEQGELFFPGDYAESIKSGERRMTIRAHDVPFDKNDIIKAKTYSNAEICDLLILEKNVMSLVRIRKAFGKYIADELERKFGPEGRFVVLRFEPYVANMAEDKREESVSSIRQRIMERVKELDQGADDWSNSGYSNPEFGIRNIQEPTVTEESGAITRMPAKGVFPTDGVGSYFAQQKNKIEKTSARQGVEQEYIWVWDGKRHLLFTEKNVQSEKEISGVEHSRLILNKKINFIDDEFNPRGFVTKYDDETYEISTYDIPFKSISWKVQMQVFETFNLPMDGSVKMVVLPAPRSFQKFQSLILVPSCGFNESELLLSKKAAKNYTVASTSVQAISDNGIFIKVEDIDRIDASKYKVLVVVGGLGSKKLSNNKKAQTLIKKFKYSILIGKSLFLAAKSNILSDTMVTGDVDVFGSAKRASAKWTGMPVEVDNNVITVVNENHIQDAFMVFANIYDEDDEGLYDQLMKNISEKNEFNEEYEGFSEMELGQEEEEEEDEGAKFLKQFDPKLKEKKEISKPKSKSKAPKRIVEVVEEEPKIELKEEKEESSSDTNELYKDLAALLGDEDDKDKDKEEDKLVDEKTLSRILKQPQQKKVAPPQKTFEEILLEVERQKEEQKETKPKVVPKEIVEEELIETEEEPIVEDEPESEESTFEEEPEEIVEEVKKLSPVEEFIKMLEEEPEETTFEDDEEMEEEGEGEQELLKGLNDEELQQLILSVEEFNKMQEEQELLKDLTDEELQTLIGIDENERDGEQLKDTLDENINIISPEDFERSSKETIETSVGRVNKEELEEVFGPMDVKEQNGEDEFEKKELNKRERARTIFGPKLEPLVDEEKNILSFWPNLQDKGPPKMSISAAEIFNLENITNDRKLSEIFNDPDQKAWQILHQEPELLQSWVLPGIVVSVGQKWFDNQKSRTSTGSIFRRLGNTPFGLFDKDDAEHLKENPELTFEDLPKGKKYIQEINSMLPQLVNSYFSNGYSGKPIGGWLKTALEREMKKIVAEANDFKEKRYPRCSVCKARSPKNPNVGRMEEITIDKKTLWYCSDCAKKSENLENNEIKSVLKEIRRSGSELKSFKQQYNTLLAQIEDENIPEGETVESMQEKLDTLFMKKNNTENFLKSLHNKKDQYIEEKNIYDAQQNVPRWHTTCPIMDCPGQRVSLTSIDWNNPFWNKGENENIKEQLYSRFRISTPEWVKKEHIQEATDEEKKDPRFVPPQWLLDVPFVCPHCNHKFTLLEARSDSDRNGDGREGVGFLTDPYFKLEWRQKGDVSKTTVSENLGENTDIEELLAYNQMADLARDIFLKKYWDKYKIVQNLKGEYGDKWEKALKGRGVMSVVQNMSLYDTARNFSIDDPIAYVAWLSERELSYKFSKEGDSVSKWTTIKNTRLHKDNIALPLLHKWVDTMLYSVSSNWEDGFKTFRLNDWLVNEKVEDISSDGPGTFFFVQIDKELEDLEEDSGNRPFGFKVNFTPAKLRGGLRSSAKLARLLRVVGMWKVDPGKVSEIKKKTYKLKGMVSKIGLRESIPKTFVQDIIKDDNKVSEIIYHDFNNVALNPDSTDLAPGDWILVQSLIMPGQYKWAPLQMVSNLREDADDERLFKNFSELAFANNDNFEYWKKFKSKVSKIKKDVSDNESLMKDQIKRLIQSEMPENQTNDSLDEHLKKKKV